MYILGKCTESTLIELLRPVCKSNLIIKSIEPLLTMKFIGKISWNHSDCHRKTHQLVFILLLKLLGRLAYFTTVDCSGIEKNQTSSLALDQFACTYIGIIFSEL